MAWFAIALGALLVIMALAQLRIHRTEKIRLKCLDQAIESRSFHGRVYSHAEKNDVVIERAIMYEHYVRGIKQDDRPPPTSSPRQTE